MQPTIHGDTVVFSYAGDLWSANLNGGDAKRLTSGAGNKAYPNFSPDGSTLAFSAAYDGAASVYTIPIAGGVPKRLTYEAGGADMVFCWTPDNQIAFGTGATSPYLGRQMEMFTVSPDGGVAKSTPVKEVFWASYFPDGHTIAYTRRPSFLYNWRRYRGGTQGVVSIYDMSANTYSELPHGREQQYYPMVVGDDIYFVSDKTDGILNLYRYNTKTKAAKKLTDFTGEDIKYARTDGKRIVFTQDGYLWVYDIASGSCHTFSPEMHADELLSRDREVDASRYIDAVTISPTGARVAVSGRGRLFSLPAHSGLTRAMSGTTTAREDHPQWSADGQSIAYISDATGETEIYSRPQMGGKATQITDLHKTITNYDWSPDNKMFAVMTIDNGLYLVDAATKKTTLVTQSKYGLGGFDFSPDSKWIAFTDAKVTETSVLKLYNIASKSTADVTSGAYQESSVAFDTSGKYLYLVSARTFAPMPGLFGPNLKIENAQRVYVLTLAKDTTDPLIPKDDEEPLKEATPPAAGQHAHPGQAGPPPAAGAPPTPPQGIKIDLDGLGSRIIPLPMPPGNYNVVTGVDNGVIFQAGGELMKYDLNAKATMPIMAGPILSMDFNPSKTMMAYAGPLGLVGVVPVAPSQFGAGRVNTTSVEFNLDTRAEWKQIYWEAWRFIRDHYYDANFRGMDWRAVGEHYATWLPYCANRNDLNVILNSLLSELGTSHAYLEAPGDVGAMAVQGVPVGCLGADYTIDRGAVRFAKIYKGDSDTEGDTGPLGLPGIDVHEGDYLLAIDGVDVTAHMNPNSLLVNKVGKVVNLTVNSIPTKEGARHVQVRPAGSETQVRYLDFIQKCRQTVDRLSNGRIGYMHIRDTAAPGSEDFARNFNAQTDKDALIVDERWNGGGYPDPQFIETLANKTYAYGQSRNGGDGPIGASVYGPMAMLINSYAGSGGDLFPWTFKRAGLGVLIGTRTWGGLVGIGAGADLVDGGSISTPSFSIYDQRTNEIIAENHGVDPDIDVDYRPDLVAKGEDPQLEAAVKYLMEKLAKMPARPVRDILPHVGKQAHVDQ